MKYRDRSSIQIDHTGLCVCCINAENCTFRKDEDQPVLQCAEFEGYACRQVNDSLISKPGGSSVLNGHYTYGDTKYLGLCSNCIHRDTCQFPRPQGGVWRCEEYA